MTTIHFPAVPRRVRDVLAGARDTVLTEARRVGDAARRTFDRVGAAVESYAEAKIKRKVKPPILVALVAAGVALVVALIVAFRK